MSDCTFDAADVVTLPPGYRRVLWIAIAISVGMLIGGTISTWNEVRNGGPVTRVPVGTDFATFDAGASLYLAGNGDDLYDERALGKEVRAITAYPQDLQRYGHPPFFALYFVPFAFVPFVAGYVLFAVGGLAAVGVAIRKIGSVPPRLAVGLTALSVPGFATLKLGQMGLWVVALFLAIYLALRRDRQFLAGVLLGLLLFKPFYAVGIGLWWLLRPLRFRVALLGAAVSAGTVALAGFLVPEGWPNFLAYLDSNLSEVVAGTAGSGFAPYEMLLKAFPEPYPLVLWTLVTVPTVLVFRWLLRIAGEQPEIAESLAVLVGLLASTRVGWYDWVLLVVPGVLLWKAIPELRHKLIVSGSWLAIAAAISWPLALLGEDHIGVFLQIAPLVLTGATIWTVYHLVSSLRAREHDVLNRCEPHDVMS